MEILYAITPFKSDQWYAALELRERILRHSIGRRFTEDELQKEAEHIHIVGLNENVVIATAVLVVEDRQAKMQRVAVKEHLQSKGVGAGLISFCEDYCLQHEIDVIYCHARNTAVDFYHQNKFLPTGDYFEEDGIPHLKMIKELR